MLIWLLPLFVILLLCAVAVIVDFAVVVVDFGTFADVAASANVGVYCHILTDHKTHSEYIFFNLDII